MFTNHLNHWKHSVTQKTVCLPFQGSWMFALILFKKLLSNLILGAEGRLWRLTCVTRGVSLRMTALFLRLDGCTAAGPRSAGVIRTFCVSSVRLHAPNTQKHTRVRPNITCLTRAEQRFGKHSPLGSSRSSRSGSLNMCKKRGGRGQWLLVPAAVTQTAL